MSRDERRERERAERRAKRRKSKDKLKASIKAGVFAKLMQEPEQRARLMESGVIDPAVLDDLPPDAAFDEMFRKLRDVIAAEIADRPSALDELDVRAIDILTPEAEPVFTDASGLVQVERTVVFSDLEGFTAFTRERGDLEASALLTDHYDAVDAIVRGRGGTVVKKLGDGHMLSFEQPAAAVMASLDLVAAAPGSLRLRAGAHGGEVVAASGDLLGDVVNVAARVTDLAGGGETVVTTVVRDRAGRLPRIVYEPPRFETVYGIEVPVEVCLVHGG